ncbi:PREDICTED: E3 ubiquitin-protein ligase ZNRF1 [Nanorana parkeri]|uniref:E3 ubiquitin-protein ligase ZNRF1 n=1 Tax=Nanorana parkeri TaxID=125878 RepID=UPI000854AEE5|nr:PREDICTED: E3 ubiquitin-protein ligase ZNRF1 [Nanorana parkeri]
MGAKQSSRSRAPFPGVSSDDSAVPPATHFSAMGLRSRSVSSVSGLDQHHPPAGTLYRAESDRGGGGGSSGDQDSRYHHPLQLAPRLIAAHSGFRCPICSKAVASDEMEMHFIMCLSKPRLSYNDDVLTRDAGECVICLEDLSQGDTIARLPCLCIYHKSCIDSWFEVNRCCPEHPSD